MHSEKTLQVIESIRNMSDKEADILEVFVAGFRAGRQTMKRDMENRNISKQAARRSV